MFAGAGRKNKGSARKNGYTVTTVTSDPPEPRTREEFERLLVDRWVGGERSLPLAHAIYWRVPERVRQEAGLSEDWIPNSFYCPWVEGKIHAREVTDLSYCDSRDWERRQRRKREE